MAEANGKSNGIKSFLHSPLAVFLLGQAILLGLAIGSTYWRTNQLSERMTKVEAVEDRMDKDGTFHSHWTDEQQGKDIAVLQSQMEKLSNYSWQFEVIKVEHARLTKDFEEIKDERKQKK